MIVVFFQRYEVQHLGLEVLKKCIKKVIEYNTRVKTVIYGVFKQGGSSHSVKEIMKANPMTKT